MSSYTRWYTDGEASATSGSTAVTGSGTYWKSAGLNPGDMLTFDNGESFKEIASVNSDTSITLARAYDGNTVTGATYAIVRNFTSTMPSRIAAQTAELLGDFKKYIDTDMQKLNGKSAYEIAKSNGYTGSESQWLESLKAAGEWETLNTRTNLLTYNNKYTHCILRGKNIGTQITAAQVASVRDGTFNDLYVGDYWTFPIDGKSFTARIMGINLYKGEFPNNHSLGETAYNSGNLGNHLVVWLYSHWSNYMWCYPINDTATCEGHIYNSKLYNETMPEILAKIKTVINPDYIQTHGDNVADSIDSNGKVNHRTYAAGQLFLPSWENLTGHRNDPENTGWLMKGRKPWPFLMYHPVHSLLLASTRLSENSSTTHWRAYATDGPALRTDAANSTYEYTTQLRPFFMIG
ncbi:MAG: hypothetical protein IJG51_11795 [Synergistaceae bacterium]|nr:hypothetical protein [Synergistaceae bacterium]